MLSFGFSEIARKRVPAWDYDQGVLFLPLVCSVGVWCHTDPRGELQGSLSNHFSFLFLFFPKISQCDHLKQDEMTVMYQPEVTGQT